ncbi:hypothetical protein [Nocardioides gilvus]|uniref:hypothetical protein n=1 Tax=Nocardioides gilvus TaxID=1735589 RepID=UPI000D7455AC|nr:hypothetical protein [Nocardioides gilvus]
MASDYRFSPAITARLLGITLLALGAIATVATVLVVWLDLHSVVVLVLTVLVLASVIALMVWSNSWVVRLSDEGYQIRRIRGAGVNAARWKEVEDAVTTERLGSPCVVLRLRDGRTSTIPVDVLHVNRDLFAHTVAEHLERGHGITQLKG